jgi:hypothetical protein
MSRLQCQLLIAVSTGLFSPYRDTSNVLRGQLAGAPSYLSVFQKRHVGSPVILFVPAGGSVTESNIRLTCAPFSLITDDRSFPALPWHWCSRYDGEEPSFDLKINICKRDQLLSNQGCLDLVFLTLTCHTHVHCLKARKAPDKLPRRKLYAESATSVTAGLCSFNLV